MIQKMISFIKRTCFFLLFIYITGSSITQAQQKNYTLLQLANAAQNHLPVLQQDQSLISSAKAIVQDTRSEVYLPKLQLNDQINAGTGNSLSGGILPMGINPSVSGGITADNNSQLATGNFATLYSQYELYDFGLKNARIKNANALVDVQNAALQKDVYSMEAEICKLYFQLIKYNVQLAADSENVKHYSDIFTVIKALAASGIKAGSDSSLSKAELSKAKITYNQTLGNILSIKQQLAYFTGISANAITVDTTALQSFRYDNLSKNLMTDSINQHPFIDYFSKQKQIFETIQLVINKSYLPKLFIAAGAWARGSSIQYNNNYEALSEGLGYQRFNYMAGLGITYDLFNEVRKKNKLNINRFQAQAMDDAISQEKLLLNNQSLQADNELSIYGDNLKELPNQLQSAREVFNETLAQYKAGIINLINLTNATFVLYRSQTDYIEALTNWYLAIVNKSAANGTLNQFIQSFK